jgi:hypothetical protein
MALFFKKTFIKFKYSFRIIRSSTVVAEKLKKIKLVRNIVNSSLAKKSS